jgi:hypothetical protein
MSRVFAYPPARLAVDYVRAALGLGGALLFWTLLPSAPQIHAVFGGLTLLFLLFTIRTVWRQLVRVEVSEDAISMAPPRRGPLAWRDIVRIDLRYYSTRRNRRDGWVTLRLTGRGTRIVIDSDLDGFDWVARRSAEAARRNGIALSDTTRANFLALGMGAEESVRPDA